MTDLDALYRRWIDELWNGDLDLADELVSADFTVHRDGTTQTLGPDGLREFVRLGRSFFSRIDFSIEVEPLVDGDRVAARWLAQGIYGGGIPGATAEAGTEVSFAGIDILRAQDGRFVEYWVASEGTYMMQQLAG